MMCMFGLPFHSKENDAERAVVFAVRVVPLLERVLGRVSIGISRGEVFCGEIGSLQLRRSYDVTGVGGGGERSRAACCFQLGISK